MTGQWIIRGLTMILALADLTLGSAALRSSSYDGDLYSARRSIILTEESNTSLGGRLTLSPEEQAANDVLMASKHEEIRRGFQDPASFLPTRNFMTVTEEIRRSKTFRIIKKMPKGALLHVHDIAMVSAEFVYENITFRENLHVCRPDEDSIDFRFMRSPDNDTTCTSSAGWELLADLRANETVAEDVNKKIRNALTLVVPDPAVAYPDVDTVWVAFSKVLSRLAPLIRYLPVYADVYYRSLAELHDDNVMYLEVRTSLPTLYDLDGNVYGPLEVTRVLKNAVDSFVNDHPDFIGAKLIYARSRKITAAAMDEQLAIAAALKTEFPDFVAGFDLVDQEDKGEPLIRFADKLRTLSPDIKLFLHAGETKWSGSSTDENLIDAVLLNTTRIGHGYALAKHPRVMELAQERGIAVEVNPISNQVLNLVEDMRNHPVSFLFARDFPVVVSSDDPGVWGAVGLSYDFYEAFVGIMSRSADIRALKQLAINSIKYSFMSEEEKTRAYTIWEAKWTKFICNVVQDDLRVSNQSICYTQITNTKDEKNYQTPVHEMTTVINSSRCTICTQFNCNFMILVFLSLYF